MKLREVRLVMPGATVFKLASAGGLHPSVTPSIRISAGTIRASWTWISLTSSALFEAGVASAAGCEAYGAGAAVAAGAGDHASISALIARSKLIAGA